jgi:hypothetical protein
VVSKMSNARNLANLLGTRARPKDSIVQVVSSTKTDDFSTTSTSYVDINGTDQSGSGPTFCVKITPSSTSNKVLVLVQCAITGSDSVGLQLVRDSTSASNQSIFLATADGSRQRYTMLGLLGTASNEIYNHGANHIHFLDSPSLTEELTYKVQGIARSGDFIINGSEYDVDNTASARTVSAITVMEIQG